MTTTTTEEKKTNTKKASNLPKQDYNLIVIYHSLYDFPYPKDDVYYIEDPEKPGDIFPYILRPGVNVVSNYYTNIFLSTGRGAELIKKNKLKIKCKQTQKSIVELDIDDKEDILINCVSIDLLKDWASFDTSFVSSINIRIKEIEDEKDELISISATRQNK